MIANRRRLEEELALVTLATNERSTVPAVSHVLLEATGKTLSLSASDIDTSLFASMSLEHETEPIRLFPPAKRLLATIRATTGESVELVARPNNRLGIRSGGHRSELPCLPVDHFSRASDDSIESWAELPAASLFALIRDGGFCLAPGHDPEAIEVRMDGKNVVVSSSDRNHVVVAASAIEIEQDLPSVSAMIGEFAVSKLEALAGRAEMLSVGIGERQVRVRDDSNRLLVCRRLNAQIPNLLDFLEKFKRFPITVTMDRQDALAAMKRLSTFTEHAAYPEIEVQIGSELKLKAGDPDHGTATELIESAKDFEGEGSFVLRYDRLSAAFRHAKGERIRIRHDSEGNAQPVLVCNEDAPGTWGWMAGTIHRKKVTP